jgi:hypothetical protein
VDGVAFAANRAVLGSGGAVAAREARVELRGDCTFEGNAASLRGGALALSGVAADAWSGEGGEGEGGGADGDGSGGGGGADGGSKLKESRVAGMAAAAVNGRAAKHELEIAGGIAWGGGERPRNRAPRGGADVSLCAGATLSRPEAALHLGGVARCADNGPSWRPTAAAAADVGADGAQADKAEADKAEAEAEQRRLACGLGGRQMLALEAMGEALELLSLPGLEGPAIDLLRTATAADPTSGAAFSTLFSALYRHGYDAAAAASLQTFAAAAPGSPMLASSQVTPRNLA